MTRAVFVLWIKKSFSAEILARAPIFFLLPACFDGQSVAIALLCAGDMNLEFQLYVRVC